MKRKIGKVEKINERTILFFKISVSIFFFFLFLLIFLSCGGRSYFEKTVYVDGLKGYNFQLHIIDVGDGDCMLVKLPNHKTMIIDTAKADESEKVLSYLTQYFKKEKVSSIDYLVITHPDADHYGGAKKIIEKFDVKTLYRPKCYSQSEKDYLDYDAGYKVLSSKFYDDFILAAYNNEVEIVFNEKGIVINENGVKIEFLSPKEESYSSTNDYSAVLMLTYQTKKFLLTGDISSSVENVLIGDYGNYLKADVLKLAHHGSKSSSSSDFLEKVNPQYAFVCIDKNNRYDCPDIDIKNKLTSLGANVLTTAKYNNFAFTVENDEIKVFYAQGPKIDLPLVFSALFIITCIVWVIPIKIKDN